MRVNPRTAASICVAIVFPLLVAKESAICVSREGAVHRQSGSIGLPSGYISWISDSQIEQLPQHSSGALNTRAPGGVDADTPCIAAVHHFLDSDCGEVASGRAYFVNVRPGSRVLVNRLSLGSFVAILRCGKSSWYSHFSLTTDGEVADSLLWNKIPNRYLNRISRPGEDIALRHLFAIADEPSRQVRRIRTTYFGEMILDRAPDELETLLLIGEGGAPLLFRYKESDTVVPAQIEAARLAVDVINAPRGPDATCDLALVLNGSYPLGYKRTQLCANPWVFSDLVPGRYRLIAMAANGANKTLSLNLHPGRNDAVIRLDSIVEQHFLVRDEEGKIVDGGRYRVRHPEYEERSTEWKDISVLGEFSVPVVMTPGAEVLVQAKGKATAILPMAKLAASDDIRPITLIDEETVIFAWTDKMDLCVQLQIIDGAGQRRTDICDPLVETRLPNLNPGYLQLRVKRDDGVVVAKSAVDIVKGERTRISLPPRPLVKIIGQVVSPQPLGSRGAVSVLSREDDTLVATVPLSSQGVFDVILEGGRRFFFDARTSLFRAQATIPVGNEADQNVELVGAPVSLFVEIDTGDIGLPSGTLVSVEQVEDTLSCSIGHWVVPVGDAAGIAPYYFTDCASNTALADAYGRARLPVPREGDYIIRIMARGFQTFVEKLFLSEGERFLRVTLLPESDVPREGQ